MTERRKLLKTLKGFEKDYRNARGPCKRDLARAIRRLQAVLGRMMT